MSEFFLINMISIGACQQTDCVILLSEKWHIWYLDVYWKIAIFNPYLKVFFVLRLLSCGGGAMILENSL